MLRVGHSACKTRCTILRLSKLRSKECSEAGQWKAGRTCHVRCCEGFLDARITPHPHAPTDARAFNGGPSTWRPPAHHLRLAKRPMSPQRGAGDCVSGLAGLSGLGGAGSGPLVFGAAAPPGVAGGTLPFTRGGAVPVAGPVAGVSVAPGALEVGVVVVVMLV